MIYNILLIFLVFSILMIGVVALSVWIHVNKKGSKIWNFVNQHIITDEDEYLKNK